jgi:hypothetical protein
MAALGDWGPNTDPPLPLAWHMDNGRPNGRAVCSNCFRDALDQTLAAYRDYLQTPEGRTEWERELADSAEPD